MGEGSSWKEAGQEQSDRAGERQCAPGSRQPPHLAPSRALSSYRSKFSHILVLPRQQRWPAPEGETTGGKDVLL